jgi:peptidoglycan hydrolase-like protein with peptidoglycan-binding domain
MRTWAWHRTFDLTNRRGVRTVSFLGSVGRQSAALFRHRGIAATAGAAALVVVAGGAYAAVTHPATTNQKIASVSDSKPLAKVKVKAKAAPPVKPLRVVSVSPDQSRDVNGAAPITVTFSAALSPATPLPSLSPKIAGSWLISGDSATFTPSVGFEPGTTVTLKIPGGSNGVQGAAGTAGPLAKSRTVRFTTGSYSVLRLQELLTQLGYLPLTWTPDDPSAAPIPAGDASAQLSAVYDPPAGTFSFKPGYPSELTSQWSTGTNNILVDGAVRAFEYNQGLTMDGIAGPQVWSALLTAVAKGQDNPNGYTYAWADQNSPESLRVWHDGKLIEDTPANTGIPQSPTVDGTFPVYLRYQVTQMKGTNPDGTKYDDTVYWVSYFNGGDALHYFPRGGYGYYQSLGCVELEYDPAKYIWPYTTYGTLVTVSGPVA